jgi:hypothetical protein
MSDKFSTFSGKFLCKTCKKEVLSMRVYTDTGMGTWMCADKHITRVQIYQVGYKKKKDYEREK